VPVVGTTASFSADEGAAIVQAHSLSQGNGWVVEHPLPQVDPTGKNYPLELSEQGSRGFAPFGKHPLYALALAAADGVGGVTAMVLLSLAGTIAAAGLAAALARRLDPSLSRPAVWVVGFASPLLFDGYLVIAHTLGAAAATGAVLAAVVAIERRSVSVALAVAPCIGLAVLMRNEAVFAALGLAATAGVLAMVRRRARLAALTVAAASVFAAGLAHFGERIWIGRLVGTATSQTAISVDSGHGSLVSGRLQGFFLTWFRASYTGTTQLAVTLTLMLAAVAVAAFAVRRHPQDRRAIVALSTLAGAAAVLALVLSPDNLVPGLLVAFPLMLAGLLLIRRPQLATTTAQLTAGTFGVFAVAVIATQYSTGGSGEWGGRYFALGLPIVIPILLLALRDAGRTLAPATRHWAGGSLAVCTIAMTVMGMTSISGTHRLTADLMARIDKVGHQASALDSSIGPADSPVIVTTSPAIPRAAWKTFDQQRWLLTTTADLPSLRQRLAASGVHRFVFVTTAPDQDRPKLGDLQILSSTPGPAGTGYQILILQDAQARS
jgi:hypothetical protein